MKKLLMSVSFLVLLSSASMAKTEIITEEVCKSPSGCRIEMTNGSCPDCVMITRTIVTKDPIVVIKEETTLIASVDPVLVSTSKSNYNRGYPSFGKSRKDCVSGCSLARGRSFSPALRALMDARYNK